MTTPFAKSKSIALNHSQTCYKKRPTELILKITNEKSPYDQEQNLLKQRKKLFSMYKLFACLYS